VETAECIMVTLESANACLNAETGPRGVGDGAEPGERWKVFVRAVGGWAGARNGHGLLRFPASLGALDSLLCFRGLFGRPLRLQCLHFGPPRGTSLPRYKIHTAADCQEQKQDNDDDGGDATVVAPGIVAKVVGHR